MTDLTPLAQSLHKTYCSASGRDVPFTMQRIATWTEWSAQGWNANDLLLVISHIKRLIREKRRWDSSLRFEKIIQNFEAFGEDLAEARSLARAPKQHPAHRELAATGRPTVPETPPARSVADILQAEKAFKDFVALKQSL